MFTKFILIGARAGFNGELAGHTFVNGAAQVPSADAELHKRILSRFYRAHPEHEFVRVGDELKHYSELNAAPTPVAKVPLEADPESFGSEDLDESLPDGVTK